MNDYLKIILIGIVAIVAILFGYFIVSIVLNMIYPSATVFETIAVYIFVSWFIPKIKW